MMNLFCANKTKQMQRNAIRYRRRIRMKVQLLSETLRKPTRRERMKAAALQILRFLRRHCKILILILLPLWKKLRTTAEWSSCEPS